VVREPSSTPPSSPRTAPLTSPEPETWAVRSPSVTPPLSPQVVPQTSPEPLPIPPRNDSPVSSLAELPRSTRSVSPLPLYIRDSTPPPPPSPPIETNPAQGPQPTVHPGEGWHLNDDHGDILFMVMIPDGDEGSVVAPFLRIDTNEGSPRLEGTLGLGCPVQSIPLHARPDRYPRPVLADQQLQIFRGGEVYTPMVNAVLGMDGDPSLQAEVYRYRAGQRRVTRAARLVVEARQALHRERRSMYESGRRLAAANAFGRVYPRVLWELADDERWTIERRQEVRRRFMFQRNPASSSSEGCLWCEGRSHNTEQCTTIRQCLLCTTWGHSERRCPHPHTLCEEGEICRVSSDHRLFRTPCAATVSTFVG
jgi:hypothetical protein